MKPTRSRSRKVLTIGVKPSTTAQQENVSEGQGSPEAQPTNGEAMTRIAEFVAENPNIFEELGRYFKRQGKQKAESSKKRSDESPEIPSEEESDGRHTVRVTPKRASSKATSRIASISKAVTRGLLCRRTEKEPRFPRGLKVNYMRAPSFTDDINKERLPSNFKLPVIPSYDGQGDLEDHIHTFISAFRLYYIPYPIICRAFPVFLQGTA